jgi:hypothetical protein
MCSRPARRLRRFSQRIIIGNTASPTTTDPMAVPMLMFERSQTMSGNFSPWREKIPAATASHAAICHCRVDFLRPSISGGRPSSLDDRLRGGASPFSSLDVRKPRSKKPREPGAAVNAVVMSVLHKLIETKLPKRIPISARSGQLPENVW